MKKSITNLIVAMLLVCTLCGICIIDSSAAESGEKIKIGYTFWDMPTAGLMRDGGAILKLAEEALGIEVVFNTSNDMTAEGVITAVENLIAAGCQGVVCCNFSEASMVNIGKLCKNNGVYFAQFYRTINDEDVAKQLEGNEYYVGRVHEDEYNAAYSLGKTLADQGCKNVALISSMHGDLTYETRAEAYRDACEDFGMNLVDEQWDVATDATATDTVVNMLNAYPEIDGFLLINCTYVPYVSTAQTNAGITTPLPMVGVDFDTTLGEDIENGTLTAVAGGHHCDPLFAVLMVYNAINGAYDNNDYPLDVLNNMILVNGVDEYNEYVKWYIDSDENFYNGQAFTMDEIRDLAITYNPDTTIEDIQAAASSLSIEDVMTRHADLNG